MKPSCSDPGQLCQDYPIAEQASVLFYGRLFEIAPAAKPLFHAAEHDATRRRLALQGASP